MALIQNFLSAVQGYNMKIASKILSQALFPCFKSIIGAEAKANNDFVSLLYKDASIDAFAVLCKWFIKYSDLSF